MKSLFVAFVFALISTTAWSASSAELTIYDTDVTICEGMLEACKARSKLELSFAPDGMRLGSGQWFFSTTVWSRSSNVDEGHRNPLMVDLGAGMSYELSRYITIGLLMSSRHCIDKSCGVESYNALRIKWTD